METLKKTQLWDEPFCLTRLDKTRPDYINYNNSYGVIKYEEEWLEWTLLCGQRQWSMGRCGGNYPTYFQDKEFEDVSHHILLFFIKIDPQLRKDLLLISHSKF